MDPYRPHPEPPPPRPELRPGHAVVVRYRPTTRTALESLEGERGFVVECAEIDHEGERDECVLVQFPESTWHVCDPEARRFLNLSSARTFFAGIHFVRSATGWFFAGDLQLE